MDSDYRNPTEAVTDAGRAAAGEAAQISRVDYDAELRMHNEMLRRSYGIRPRDRVLDVGCGAGQTTRDAARLAVAGSVLGVDVSAPMIERARRRTKAAGLRNVTFEQADAESHHFTAECFDVAISRFGTMPPSERVVGLDPEGPRSRRGRADSLSGGAGSVLAR